MSGTDWQCPDIQPGHAKGIQPERHHRHMRRDEKQPSRKQRRQTRGKINLWRIEDTITSSVLQPYPNANTTHPPISLMTNRASDSNSPIRKGILPPPER